MLRTVVAWVTLGGYMCGLQHRAHQHQICNWRACICLTAAACDSDLSQANKLPSSAKKSIAFQVDAICSAEHVWVPCAGVTPYDQIGNKGTLGQCREEGVRVAEAIAADQLRVGHEAISPIEAYAAHLMFFSRQWDRCSNYI